MHHAHADKSVLNNGKNETKHKNGQLLEFLFNKRFS